MEILTGGLGVWASNIWNTILIMIDYGIYLLINISYEIFAAVSKVEVFSTDKVSVIANRIYTILGIVMLFVLAYNIILGIIDPDSMNKGDKSIQSIAKNTIISIVLITLFPLICEYLHTFQKHIIDNGTIGNLILGSTVSNTKGSSTAYQIPVTIFTAFYHPLNENKEAVTLMECENGAALEICSTYSKLARDAEEGSAKLRHFMFNGDLIEGIYYDEMEYLFPLSTIAGALAAYLFLSFSIDLGVRAAKLGALKLIAPVPIFLRITKPKGGQFDKWFSDFTKTYLQVFERLMIVYFAVLIISFVPDITWTTSNVDAEEIASPFIRAVASVVIILGILKFAKDAPKMLEDLFSIKIPEMSLKKKLNDNEYAKRAAGLGGAAVGALSKPFINNAIKGFQKDPTDGKRHILRGFGRATVGTLRDLPGTIPGVLNSARRGWQNGNVGDWREMGEAVGNARAQNQADMNNIKNKFKDGIAKHNSAIKDPGAWLEKKGKEIGESLEAFANGPELSNEKLTAAKAMTDKFNFLFNKFKDKSIEDAMNAALKDYNGGKSVRFRTSFTGTDGVTYNPGDAVPVSALSADLIKKHFEGLQGAALLKNFNEKQNSEGLKMQTKIISEQMVKTLNTLGEEAQKEVLKDRNGNTISVGDIEAIIQRASEQRMTANDMADLRTVAKAMDAQYKSQDFGVASEKQKEEK